MNKIFIGCLLLLVASFSAKAQQSTWKIDPSHSNINFGVSYFKAGTIKGTFNAYSGTITKENNTLSLVNITIETGSINTNQINRDKHLKTADFFDAEKHPEMTFRSTKIIKTTDNTYEITGDFTMTGITKSIVLKATDNGTFVHPRFKTNNKFISISGIIKREDFKVGTNYALAKFALGNEVTLVAEIHLIEEK